MNVLLTALLLVLSSSLTIAQQLYVNELMASNSHTLADNSGSFEDWIEIYNPNNFSVDIAGYYITDNLSNHTKSQFPTGSSQTIIPANGFLIVWASEEPSRGPLHATIKLSADGEAVGLYRTDGSTVDEVTFGPQRADVSWGRQPNGTANWFFFGGSNVSPGSSNNDKTGYSTVLAEPVFSQIGGFYSSGFTLNLSTTDPTATIYYTLDGSDPDPANLTDQTYQYKNYYAQQPGQSLGDLETGHYQTYAYSGSIAINDRTSAPNKESVKASSFFNPPSYFPISPVFKGTVVRAIAYKAGALSSNVVTQTYFIAPTSPARYTVPVVSIATNEKSFFEYFTGIYTPGKAFDDWRSGNPNASADFCTPGNYTYEGDSWERRANVEFFLNNNSIINQPVGLRINGGCTVSVPRKSVRLYGDSDFDYPFFSNRPSNQFYNRLLLRNGGNDWDYSLIIDAYMQTIVRHLKFDTQSNRASVVFVNGEYWGIHSLYERYDKYYLNRNYNVSPDSVDIVSLSFGIDANEGDLTAYNAMLSYFTNTSPVSYSYVATKMDVENFTDYQISEIYSANDDWPNNNQQLWRKRTSQYLPRAPYGQDGRFRWMMKDVDHGLSYIYRENYNHNTLALATDNTLNATFPLRRLLELPDYKAYFINRYADLLNTTFNQTRTVAMLNAVEQEYQPYITEHFDRWRTSKNLTTWTTNVNYIRTFVQQRPSYAREHIRSKFGLSNDRNVTVSVSDTSRGYVKVNTIDILPTTAGVPASPYPWTGLYFQGNTIRIVAKAKAGYRFVAWQENGTTLTTDTAYSYNPTTDRSFTAVFDFDESFGGNPSAYNLATCAYRFDAWPATSAAGTYPSNTYLVSMSQDDPPLSATYAVADTVKGTYNYSSSTRINGLGSDGLSFINTGGANVGYIATRLGGMVLALRTVGLTEAYVQWRGGTVTPNPRQYAIRLRYRIGSTGPFTDLLDGSNQVVEYVRNASAGHSQVIGPVALPASLLNKPYVQLLWQYYWTGVGSSGARDQLRIDDIEISRGVCQSVASGDWNAASTWSCGRIPSLCDDVLIADDHTVTLLISNANARSLRFGTNARLIYANATASLFIRP
ncbi:CotH kinase family protein [Spirosoma sp. SC4-14]|uniref:CotH kinase family protein n=1 Tax=Spirosoma sp. SC4-14 TaxID=3128900 RepID=UPI0030CDB904